MEKFTTHRVLLIFKDGADCVNTDELSKGSSIGFKIWEDDVNLWDKIDSAVRVWPFDRYLADLMNSKEKHYKNFSMIL